MVGQRNVIDILDGLKNSLVEVNQLKQRLTER
jgi:hypothetical protein